MAHNLGQNNIVVGIKADKAPMLQTADTWKYTHEVLPLTVRPFGL